MFSAITTLIYQPFLNLLVFFYWMLEQIGFGADMGVAVILLTVAIRILLLPITLASHRSESERREIENKAKEIREAYKDRPIERDQAIKKLLRANPRILFAEMFMFFVQFIIALILWEIFARGLGGHDLHLLYDWLPEVQQPYQLMFLGRYDLTHPDWHLNVVQALLIFVLETVGVILSPYAVSRQEVVRVQLVLPVVSFMIFAFLPAGKKLFVITTLSFSLIITLLRAIVSWYKRVFSPPVNVENFDESIPIESMQSSPPSLQ